LPRGYDVLLHPALEVDRGEDNYRLLRRMGGIK
jgi:hypothetical protein